MKRIAIIGAGAAGTMAAIFAASPDWETMLLESTPDGGRKILISGGGRCNVLPAVDDGASRFVTDSSRHTLRNILRSWPLAEQVRFFEDDVGIPLAEERESAKLFPVSNRAREVRDKLLALAERHGVRFLKRARVTGLDCADADSTVSAATRGKGSRPSRRWRITREGGDPLDADAVVLATGGLSVPATGSDGAGLEIARRLGHTIHPTYAALTPILAAPHPFPGLSGVSLEVTLAARDGRGADRRATATGGFLFTHGGYSGPSVLDVSHVLVRAAMSAADSREEAGDLSRHDGSGNRAPAVNRNPALLEVRWTDRDEAAWDEALRSAAGGRTVAGALRAALPERLADALARRAGVDPAVRLADLPRSGRIALVKTLVRGELPWTGHEGYKKAEVTGGGVDLAEIDPRTMESRLRPGLFLCGEMLDAFGPIGGYNFQWAWATGRAAGLGAAQALRTR